MGCTAGLPGGSGALRATPSISFPEEAARKVLFSRRASSPRTRKSCASWHILFAGSPLRLLFRNYIIAAHAGLRIRKFHQLEYQLFPGTQPLFTVFFSAGPRTANSIPRTIVFFAAARSRFFVFFFLFSSRWGDPRPDQDCRARTRK